MVSNGSISIFTTNGTGTIFYEWSHDNTLNQPTADNLIGNTYTVTVTDENGEAVIATTVLIKGTKIGTLTDLDGNYTLEVPEEIKNPILVFSSIGLNSQEVTIGPNTNFNIVMNENSVVLDEVMIVGYGMQRVVGSVEEEK